MDEPTYVDELAFAEDLVDRAGELALSYFRNDPELTWKADATPVTEADLAVEAMIREELGQRFPDDAIRGEEGGIAGASDRMWIIDPIDGTRNYSRGIPVWATLIALEEEGAIVLGVVSAPALGRRWWAERGAGAYANGDPIHVSRVGRVEDAVLCFALEHPLPQIAQRCWHPRAYGDFWAHMLVAEGAVDGAIDAIGVKIWDLAALQPIVEEAGGQFTDRQGVARADGSSAVSSNGLLHEALLAG
jgi:histidinol-phosphatase